MKGIIINEGSPLLENKYVNACYIQYADLTVQLALDEGVQYCLSGVRNKSAGACCSKHDTYDFETGALIALMKMCGLEKSAKAYAEIFDDTAYGDALIERDNLKEQVKDLWGYNNGLIRKIEQENRENISLKKDSESFRKRCEKLKEENERLYEIRDLLTNKNNELMEKNERLNKSICAKGVLNGKLLKDYNAAQSTYEIMVEKSADLMDKVKKLEEENEKLQHGYIDTDMMYSIYKESREKAELDGYGITFSWELKVPTKREKMWDEILKEGRTPVYVERKDVHDFLEECQIAGVKWTSGKMPLETMPFHMSDGYDGLYFFVMTSLDISKCKHGTKGFRHVMSWWVTASDEEVRNSIKYIPPMRWDLFEKGRLAVKVNYNNYKEFYEACEKVLGKEPFRHTVLTTVYAGPFTVSICKKDGNFEVFSIKDQKKTGRKIVDWEDVK